MLKYIATGLFAIILLSSFPAVCQSGDNGKVLYGNEWIRKYKRLKSDLENKVAKVKEMEDLSERDIEDIRDSYNRTSLLLENWLLQVVSVLETAEPAKMESFSKGSVNPELQASFGELLTAYSNDFTTLYEEKTGFSDNLVMSMESNGEVRESMTTITWKFEREELMVKIQPLLPSDWNSIN